MAKITIDYWRSDPGRIATAYKVERDGRIFEVFDPKYDKIILGQYRLIDDTRKGLNIHNQPAFTKILDFYNKHHS